jgi:hypothetical protein
VACTLPRTFHKIANLNSEWFWHPIFRNKHYSSETLPEAPVHKGDARVTYSNRDGLIPEPMLSSTV